MKQLNVIDDLGWLLDENWRPKEVKHITNNEKVRSDAEVFDTMWSKSMGYETITHMNEHNLKRDRAYYLKYGDMVKGLI